LLFPAANGSVKANNDSGAGRVHATGRGLILGFKFYRELMNATDLETIAQALVVPGKGILAADESTPTITKRFQAIEFPSTEQTRRAWREMLFTTPGLGDFISGVILFDETIRQKARDGTPFVEVLRHQDIIPGIKVDKGAKPLARFPGEKVTEGLDGLRERLDEYVQLGARFTKWRAVIRIADGIPTRICLAANAHALVRFAATSQEAGLVPIVEPEVLMDGDHAIERCEEVTESILRLVFRELAGHRVALEQMLLKVNMILPGKDCSQQASVLKVAEATLRCMRRAVPPAVHGIVFLSGGQDDIPATQHLNAMNQIGNVPWQLSFSYGRALQAPALRAWHGKDVRAGQRALRHRAECNSAARYGRYSEKMEEWKSPLPEPAAAGLK
jgi:fructose-bisphosphate aldolase class I